jgi:hypothetical protein
MKPLSLALVAGLMLGCATDWPLRVVALREVQADDGQAGGAPPNQAGYRSTGEKAQVAAVLAGTVFDDASPDHPGALPNPDIHLLPDINAPNPQAEMEPSLGQSSETAGITGNAPVEKTVEPPAFAAFEDHPILYNLLNDQRNFYRCASLEWLAGGIGIAAIFANTHVDQGFRDAYGETFRPADDDLDFLKEFGDGLYVIPAVATIWAVDYAINWAAGDGGYPCTGWLQEWSGRTARGLIVGALPLLTLQYTLGSSRPSDGVGSGWHPFQNDHGVSGHAFVGAIPFWTAAQMTDFCPLEMGFFGAGTLAGWSRIHTDSHYLSQVMLGWWLAGLSVSAVNHTQLQKRQWFVTPTVDDEGTGIALIHLW